MTESTSHIEREIQRRIQAQRVKVAAAKERRASLAEARKAGLAHRHAAKLRHLAEREQLRLDAEDYDQADGPGPPDFRPAVGQLGGHPDD
ncbi:hypothetical protein QA942_10255 [Streptomyces sp. B21-106]|uniref:hypothetical protein n=1 Tax=Streptomyces sp. B21-106 TaxID=3039418 RepID=UPI002FEE87D1